VATAIPAPVGAVERVRDVARRVTETVRTTAQALPRQAVPEIVGSVNRLRKVRTPLEALEAFETETERLLTVVAPLLVDHPLPVRSTKSAKAIVATAGGLAAAGEEAEAIAAIVSSGSTLAPTLPLVLGANLVALAVEISVAASLRVHDLKDAGIEPDPQEVARDVIFAMTGRNEEGAAGRHVTKRVVKLIVRRVLSRWGKSLVPVIGIAYSGWDAQRTIDAIRALPLPERRTAVDV
jgi:hypothetical protein